MDISRLDACIMTVRKCMMSHDISGGQRQKTYMDTFQKVLFISIVQLSDYLYKFMKEWESEDLNIATEWNVEAISNGREAKERAFRKAYNACVPDYVRAVNRSYLAICSDWFLKYVGNDLSNIYDSWFVEVSKKYSKLNKICAKREELNE